VENQGVVGLIYRQHLRLRVEINTDLPLVSGFLIPRPDKDPLWVSFKYERLADYCSLCGLIGHRNFNCPTANSVIPMENFGMSLKAMASTSLVLFQQGFLRLPVQEPCLVCFHRQSMFSPIPAIAVVAPQAKLSKRLLLTTWHLPIKALGL
jgi:hypothetical protein